MSRTMGVIIVALLCAILAVLAYPYWERHQARQEAERRALAEFLAAGATRELASEGSTETDELARECANAASVARTYAEKAEDAFRSTRMRAARSLVRCVQAGVADPAILETTNLARDFPEIVAVLSAFE